MVESSSGASANPRPRRQVPPCAPQCVRSFRRRGAGPSGRNPGWEVRSHGDSDLRPGVVRDQARACCSFASASGLWARRPDPRMLAGYAREIGTWQHDRAFEWWASGTYKGPYRTLGRGCAVSRRTRTVVRLVVPGCRWSLSGGDRNAESPRHRRRLATPRSDPDRPRSHPSTLHPRTPPRGSQGPWRGLPTRPIGAEVRGGPA